MHGEGEAVRFHGRTQRRRRRRAAASSCAGPIRMPVEPRRRVASGRPRWTEGVDEDLLEEAEVGVEVFAGGERDTMG